MSSSTHFEPAAIPGRSCPACGGDLHALPELPQQSMLSDGRIVPDALRRIACTTCGLAMLLDPPGDAAAHRIFAADYDLYAHAPGNTYERERQRRYADWIRDIAATLPHGRVFEVGCGNASLLAELRELWPEANFAGIEPAPAAVPYARQAGFVVQQGFLESGELASAPADLVLSVNVIEHTPDPVRFLRAFGDCMTGSGRGIVICPDGDTPSAELLIRDHLYSLSEAALRRFCDAAGLGVAGRWKSPPGLHGFQAVLVQRPAGGPAPVSDPPTAAATLFEARKALLSRWQLLDARLEQRTAGIAEIGCFGIGEAAQLLRAYAPGLWRKFALFTVDGGDGQLDDRPVLDYAALKPVAGRAFLLAVRAELQEIIGRRLKGDGHETVAWADLVLAP
jgi:SAM-dependent methyltransferase